MGPILRELLLVDLLIQLLIGVLRLAGIVGAVLLLALLISGRCIGGLCFPQFIDLEELFGPPLQTAAEPGREPECPKFADAFPQLLPDTWILQHVRAISVDGDEDKECLAIYQYNRGSGLYGGLLGGVVYDPQPDRSHVNLEATVPFRPAVYVPYHLLPREDGMGFLSERGGNWDQIVQVYDADGDNKEELVIQGFSAIGAPAYLSIFKWVDKKQGFKLLTSPVTGPTIGGTIWGDAGIEVRRQVITDEVGTETLGPIEEVLVKSRPAQPFWYFRSQLCYVRILHWNQNKTNLEPVDYYLTFCFGRPDNAEPGKNEYFLWYPEEALMARYEDGRVREIQIPAHPVGNMLQATVTLREGTQQRWLVTWKLHEQSDGKLSNMTSWVLEQIGEPYDP